MRTIGRDEDRSILVPVAVLAVVCCAVVERVTCCRAGLRRCVAWIEGCRTFMHNGREDNNAGQQAATRWEGYWRRPVDGVEAPEYRVLRQTHYALSDAITIRVADKVLKSLTMLPDIPVQM